MMIDCPECHDRISDAAATCVHCGYPVKRHPVLTFQEKALNVRAIFMAFLMLLGIVGMLLGGVGKGLGVGLVLAGLVGACSVYVLAGYLKDSDPVQRDGG